MEATMGRKALLLLFSMVVGLASFAVVHVCGTYSPVDQLSDRHYREKIRKMQAYRANFFRHDSVSLPPSASPSPSYERQPPVNITYVSLCFLFLNWYSDITGRVRLERFAGERDSDLKSDALVLVWVFEKQRTIKQCDKNRALCFS